MFTEKELEILRGILHFASLTKLFPFQIQRNGNDLSAKVPKVQVWINYVLICLHLVQVVGLLFAIPITAENEMKF